MWSRQTFWFVNIHLISCPSFEIWIVNVAAVNRIMLTSSHCEIHIRGVHNYLEERILQMPKLIDMPKLSWNPLKLLRTSVRKKKINRICPHFPEMSLLNKIPRTISELDFWISMWIARENMWVANTWAKLLENKLISNSFELRMKIGDAKFSINIRTDSCLSLPRHLSFSLKIMLQSLPSVISQIPAKLRFSLFEMLKSFSIQIRVIVGDLDILIRWIFSVWLIHRPKSSQDPAWVSWGIWLNAPRQEKEK